MKRRIRRLEERAYAPEPDRKDPRRAAIIAEIKSRWERMSEPERALRRPDSGSSKRASRGGSGVGFRDERTEELIDELTAKALSGDVEPAVLRAVVALHNAKLRAIEIERRLEESGVRAEFEELKRELGIG
jgi:hypothetical protein